jgi:hypothetical protein
MVGGLTHKCIGVDRALNVVWYSNYSTGVWRQEYQSCLPVGPTICVPTNGVTLQGRQGQSAPITVCQHTLPPKLVLTTVAISALSKFTHKGHIEQAGPAIAERTPGNSRENHPGRGRERQTA